MSAWNGPIDGSKRKERSRETRLVRRPMLGGTWPEKLVVERLRWVSLVSRSNPVDGISDIRKSFPARLRYLREVSSKSERSRLGLSKPRSP